MKKALTVAIPVLCAIGLLVFQGRVMAVERVLAIGDSWGYALSDPLNNQLSGHGHGDYHVFNAALLGATADAYANNVGGALDITLGLLAVTPTIEVVFISLGGNDLWSMYPSLGDEVFGESEADLRYLVDRILQTRPDVQILFAGYDILKFDKSDFCLLFAYNCFGRIFPWEVSPLFIEIGNAQRRIADDYPSVTSLSLWGTGQGSPGSPDITKWSPSSYVASGDEDCLHLSDSGYNQFALQIYCSYFAPRFGESCQGSAWGAASVAGTGLNPWSAGSGRLNGVALVIIPLVALFVLRWSRKR